MTTPPRKTRAFRLALGAIVGPPLALAASAVALVVVMMIEERSLSTPTGDPVHETILPLVFTAIEFGMFLGLPAMAVFGLPLHALLQRLRLTSPWPYIAGGAAAGAVAGGVGMTAMFGHAGNGAIFLLGAFTGALAGWFFWLFRRPDRD